jgi:hypothetical protein
MAIGCRFGEPADSICEQLRKLCLFGGRPPEAARLPGLDVGSYLVDPASNICLYQRLSHACLSISNYTVKLRMAH